MQHVSRLGVGFGIIDTCAFAALVFSSVAALDFSSAAALVCDCVLRAGAVCGTLIGVDTLFCLCFTTFLGWTSSHGVVGCTIRTSAPSELVSELL